MDTTRTALVTGSTRGIGREVVRQLAAAGWRVFATGRDTAAHIPGARLHEIPGMGHDLPLELVDTMADLIAGHAKAA